MTKITAEDVANIVGVIKVNPARTEELFPKLIDGINDMVARIKKLEAASAGGPVKSTAELSAEAGKKETGDHE